MKDFRRFPSMFYRFNILVSKIRAGAGAEGREGLIPIRSNKESVSADKVEDRQRAGERRST